MTAGWLGATSNDPQPSGTGGTMPCNRGARGVADRWATATVPGGCAG
jgi:hypothetical protein